MMKGTTALVSILLAMLLLLMPPRAEGASITLDFETDAAGNPILAKQIIDDEYAGFGVTILVDNVGGGPDLGVAFDSGNPTGGDTDLATPGTVGNFVPPGVPISEATLGNLLIIQEHGAEDPGNPGFITHAPDDEGSNPAGNITFTFDGPIASFGFHLVDIEDNSAEQGGYFAAFYSGGNQVGSVTFGDLTTVGHAFYDPTIVFGNNSVNRVQPFLASDPFFSSSAPFFDMVIISLGGSGAVDNVVFNPVPVPEPGTLLLLGTGLAGLAGYCRRRRQRARRKDAETAIDNEGE